MNIVKDSGTIYIMRTGVCNLHSSKKKKKRKLLLYNRRILLCNVKENDNKKDKHIYIPNNKRI